MQFANLSQITNERSCFGKHLFWGVGNLESKRYPNMSHHISTIVSDKKQKNGCKKYKVKICTQLFFQQSFKNRTFDLNLCKPKWNLIITFMRLV